MPSPVSNPGLLSCAFADQGTQGRRHPEKPHPYRTEYQRDRDRILHSKAFRRLENKTQVFGPQYSDHFRNRLTHTLEVNQIARTVSQALGLNTDLVEALALSHDIGHPPFSHEGESALDALMRRHGAGFDHNLHALTIVEDFEEKYASFRGLNLTFEVREGMIKHSRDYDGSEDCYIDIGEYRIGQRPPLEAQLIDLADEIAYNSADLDDGFDSGLLELPQVLEGSELFSQLYSGAARRFPQAPAKLLVREAIRGLIDRLATSLIEETRRRIEESSIRSVEQVRRHSARLVGLDDSTDRFNREIKGFLRRNLYNHPRLKAARRRARQMIERLFSYYWQDPSRLPPSHYSRLSPRAPHWAICNYIAGMTDKYAQSTFEKVFPE